MYEPNPEDWKTFRTLAEFRAATGQEAHGIEVDFDDFERMTPPDPAKRHAVYHAMDLNFRLKPTAGRSMRACDSDRQRRLRRRAPRTWAHWKSAQPEPHYGPRWLKGQPFYR